MPYFQLSKGNLLAPLKWAGRRHEPRTVNAQRKPGRLTTFDFRNCTGLSVQDNILAAAFQTPRPSNVFIQLGSAPETCNGYGISSNMMLFNDNEGTGINVPAGNLNGGLYDNRFFGNSVNDIVCNEPSTVITSPNGN